jgi:hypothetical protein
VTPATGGKDAILTVHDEGGTTAMYVDKAEIIAVLRSRGLHDRADWVDRALPPVVDAHRNGSLLRMLHIDPTAIEKARS